VLGTAIAERHGSEDEPDPTPSTRDGRDGVKPTWLTSYRRVKQKGVNLRCVGQRCIGQGLVQVGTMPAADLLRHARPSTVREQLEERRDWVRRGLTHYFINPRGIRIDGNHAYSLFSYELGPDGRYDQFSTVKFGTLSNSLTLSVTTTRSEARASAAINMSIAPMGCPLSSRHARIAP
jgi:hypothetical protein